ncbi:MAG: hypothetical protein OXI15_08330 [Chromatiales bacterium]|nr:hypothetical protein [Chromatiales bacterium]
MRIEAEAPESGQKFSGVASGLDENIIDEFFNSFNLSDEEIRRWIARLDISADAKSILYKIAKTTIRAGQFVIKVGRKILEIVSFLLREYPNATLWLIFGAVVGVLVTSIPVIGVVIGPLFTTLAMVVGFAMGAWEDIKDKNMKRKMQEEMVNFEKLRTE